MFFNKKKQCEDCEFNSNADLKKLQELTVKLEELKNKKENMPVPPKYADYDRYPIARRSFGTDGGITWLQCEDLAFYFAQAMVSKLNVFDFINFVRNHLPEQDVQYLNDLGEYLIAVSQCLDEQQKLDIEIKKTEGRIVELKKKLHI